MRLIEDSYRVRSYHLLKRKLHSRFEIDMAVDLGVFNQLYEHFGVGV